MGLKAFKENLGKIAGKVFLLIELISLIVKFIGFNECVLNIICESRR